MSQPEVVQPEFIPAPIDGLNLVAAVDAFGPREAIELQNYLCYDFGILERRPEAQIHTKVAKAMFPFFTLSGSEKMLLVASDNKVWLMASPTDASPTDVTGAVSITNTASWNLCAFNKRIFGFNEVDAPWVYNVASGGNVATTGITGPTLTQIAFGFNFKSRLYIFEGVSGNPTKGWYSATPGAITGAFSSIDFAEVFNTSSYILTGFSWAFNQGSVNDELFVLIGINGEVLFYSGDYPAAPNWQLIARGTIPKPIGRKPFVKYGQDILVSTVRGLIPLSHVFAGMQLSKDYFAVSRKIGAFAMFSERLFAIDTQTPFLFGATGGATIWVQNYERGAWSTFSVASAPTVLACFSHYLMFGTSSGTNAMYIPESAPEGGAVGENTAAENTRCIWKTPWRYFGQSLERLIKLIRVYGADFAATAYKNKIYINSNFNDPGTVPTTLADANTPVSASGTGVKQTLSPPGSGTQLQICFSKIPAGEQNMIRAVELFTETGGAF